ncbi:Ig-like domain-containing protein, partial [Motilibacter aurantiacus]|uniref:Ig-like domain-containing protein n=1 Tax=Motilibacter aurantiacus TaxID=2714955 RepID=UPI0014096FAC
SSITAQFVPSGTGSVGSTSTALSYTITAVPNATTTALTASPASPQQVGTAVTLTATVTPAAAAGTVTFRRGSETLGTAAVANGVAMFTTSALPVGTSSVTAEFAPTGGNYTGSTSSALSYVVTAAPAATTTTLVASPASPQQVGTAVTLTAEVSPAAAGTVQFRDGSTSLGSAPVAGGKATISTSTLAVGTRTLTAVFTPSSAEYLGSTSAALSYTITAAPVATTTALTASPASPQVQGTNVTFTATVSPAAAAGSVTFRRGSDVLGTVAVSNGTAAYSTTGLPVGTSSVTAEFVPSGAAYIGSTSAAVSFTVTAAQGGGIAVTGGATISVSARQMFSAAVGVVVNSAAPSNALSATIEWGDGQSSTGILAGPNGFRGVFGTHMYASAGTYTVTVKVTGPNGTSGSVTRTVVVS